MSSQFVAPQMSSLPSRSSSASVVSPGFALRSGAFTSSDLSDLDAIQGFLIAELARATRATDAEIQTVAHRLAVEIDRVCCRSERIQSSGEVRSWALNLANQRLERLLSYYRAGTAQGRADLHSTLSAMVYRYVTCARQGVSFQARRTLIDDFLQNFYLWSLEAFRRENQLDGTFTPRRPLEMAEFLMFVEQYAKRRIGLRGQRSQQLIVLRAQSFAKRQPPEMALDIEQAAGSSRPDEDDRHHTGSQIQQVREQMVAEAHDPAEAVLRERVISQLMDYLAERGQTECANYLSLRLQDLSAPEIDQILSLTPRQRDYLQQRFRYHITRFALMHHWQLVHQWLEADLDQRLGMSAPLWEKFLAELSEGERQLLVYKQAHLDDRTIARKLRWTAKQLQMRWFALLARAWEVRNDGQGLV